MEAADPLLAGQHQVNDREPVPQRLVGVLEDRARYVGELIAVWIAGVALPFVRAACNRVMAAQS